MSEGVGQVSPDKDVIFGHTTAAFPLSPEPGASSCGTLKGINADLPGNWA